MKKLVSLVTLLLLAGVAGCRSASSVVSDADPVESMAACISQEIDPAVDEWLKTSASQHKVGVDLNQWSFALQQKVPAAIGKALVQAANQAASERLLSSHLGDLNAYHDRLLENFFEIAATSLHVDRCGNQSEIGEVLYAQIVSRLGSEVGSAPANVVSRFNEAGQFGRNYSGNVLFVWLSLQSRRHGVPVAAVLDRYLPAPDRGTIFK